MTNWLKYNLVCPDCDTLFEITTLDFVEAPNCVCGSNLTLLGWEDANVTKNTLGEPV